METIKVIIIGDCDVGKSSLVSSFIYGEDYDTPIGHNHKEVVKVNDKEYELDLWDISSNEYQSSQRKFIYPQANVFIVCYSIISLNSYNNVKNIWIKEIKESNPNSQIILVATKKDLRHSRVILDMFENKNISIVPENNLETLGRIINAYEIQECSSLERDGIDDVFVKAIKAYEDSSKIETKYCCNLM